MIAFLGLFDKSAESHGRMKYTSRVLRKYIKRVSYVCCFGIEPFETSLCVTALPTKWWMIYLSMNIDCSNP